MPGRILYPIAAAHDGGVIDRLFVQVHLLMAAVFLAWLYILGAALWRARARRTPGRPLSPAFVYGTVLVVLVVEIGLEWGGSNPIIAARLDAAQSHAGAVEVHIVAQRYAWNVHYPGPDGVFGKSRPELVNDVSNPLGLDMNDPHAKDDIVKLNEVHLPVGRKALIWLSSRDVVHSFNAPEMRVKQDAFPGMRTAVTFTPTMTTDEFRKAMNDPQRNFEIACAQLCGQGHASMRAFLFIDTPEAYAKWLGTQTGAGDDAWGTP